MASFLDTLFGSVNRPGIRTGGNPYGNNNNLFEKLGIPPLNQDAPTSPDSLEGDHDMLVTGHRKNFRSFADLEPVDAPAVEPTFREPAEEIQRKGLFGMKGTLRDVVGILGDAFLVQSGNERIYAPQRDRERMGDAMYGAAQGPDQALAAADRLAAMGYPSQAAAVLEQAQRQQLSQAQLDSLNANRESLQEKRQLDNLNSQIEGIRNSLYRVPPTMRDEILDQTLRAKGLTREDIGLMPGMRLDDWIMAGIDITQGERFIRQDRKIGQTDRRLDQADTRNSISARNADSSARRATVAEEREARQAAEEEENKRPRRPRSPRGSSSRFGPPRNN